MRNTNSRLPSNSGMILEEGEGEEEARDRDLLLVLNLFASNSASTSEC